MKRLAPSCYLTLSEAASTLAEHYYPEIDADIPIACKELREGVRESRKRELFRQLCAAAQAGILQVLSPRTKLPCAWDRDIKLGSLLFEADYRFVADVVDFHYLVSMDGVNRWLDSVGAPYRLDDPAAAKKPGLKARRQAEVKRLLNLTEARCQAHGIPFDREHMPGVKADFITVLKASSKDLQALSDSAIGRYYLPGACQFKPGVQQDPALRVLFPEHFPDKKQIDKLS